MRRSVDWSIKNRGVTSITQDIAQPRSALESVRIIDAQVEEESHIRAFISHFKIELNKLMDLRWNQRRSHGMSESSSDCCNEPISFIVCRDDVEENFTRKRPPIVTLNGRHCGLYHIGDQNSDDDSNGNTPTPPDADDDGYRSLSRESYRSSMVQQLVEIKSRLMDLIHEIDQVIKFKVQGDEIDSYRRRWNALISILDSLIDSCSISQSTEVKTRSTQASNSKWQPQVTAVRPNDLSISSQQTLSLTVQSSPFLSRNRSDSDLHSSDGYEEQVRVIDYGYQRRSSDSKALESNRLAGDEPYLISNIVRGQPIDFGAMMRNYEASQQKDELQDQDNTKSARLSWDVQHNQSNSSTSCYSLSSKTSSSSIL